jgi:AraC-like DNA-binding protein
VKFIRANQVWGISEAFSGEKGSLEMLAYRMGYHVGEICNVLGCSQRHLYAVFMRDIGISPKVWLESERMVVARRKLKGGASIRQVSDSLGYSTVVAFTRRFERIYGMPPGRYVKSRWVCGSEKAPPQSP